VFRVIEAQSPTPLIDEADTFFRTHEELRGIINSGHTKRNAYVVRTVGDDHEPKSFSPWGAKAMAGIGKMADTVMDRAIILSLRRKLPNLKVERLRYVEPGLLESLARMLARFGEDHGATIGRARPSLPAPSMIAPRTIGSRFSRSPTSPAVIGRARPERRRWRSAATARATFRTMKSCCPTFATSSMPTTLIASGWLTCVHACARTTRQHGRP